MPKTLLIAALILAAGCKSTPGPLKPNSSPDMGSESRGADMSPGSDGADMTTASSAPCGSSRSGLVAAGSFNTVLADFDNCPAAMKNSTLVAFDSKNVAQTVLTATNTISSVGLASDGIVVANTFQDAQLSYWSRAGGLQSAQTSAGFAIGGDTLFYAVANGSTVNIMASKIDGSAGKQIASGASLSINRAVNGKLILDTPNGSEVMNPDGSGVIMLGAPVVQVSSKGAFLVKDASNNLSFVPASGGTPVPIGAASSTALFTHAGDAVIYVSSANVLLRAPSTARRRPRCCRRQRRRTRRWRSRPTIAGWPSRTCSTSRC